MRLGQPARLAADALRLLRSQWWDSRQIAAYQQERLVRMLRHAVETVPFYSALGLRPEDIRTPEDLQRFPVLTKAAVQRSGPDLLSRQFDVAKLHRSRSSGMTGEPTVTYFDDESWRFTKHALKLRRILSATRSPFHRLLNVSELDVPDESWPLLRVLAPFVGVRHLALRSDLQTNLEALVAFRPTIVHGFPSYLGMLASAARERAQRLPPVRLIYTSSEVLTSAARDKIATAFRGRVVDIYGSTEFKEIAVQCEHGRYHLNFESVHVESLPGGEGAAPRLLVTTLVNRAMPLIRYEVGDTGTVERADCACGRSGPQIAGLLGRLSEMLSFPDGTQLSPYLLTTAIEQWPQVEHYRIVHEAPWSLRIETLAAPALTAQELARVDARLRALLPAQVAVRFVPLTDRGAAGKRRAVAREF